MQCAARTTVNIRLDPSLSGEDVGNLPAGSVVEVLEGGTAEFAAVQFYVAREFLEEVGTGGQEVTASTSGGFNFSTTKGTIAAIAAECRTQGLNLPEQIAYVLATAEHETDQTFQPIPERGPDSYFDRYEGRSDLGNDQPGDGLRFKGRGFVQITGRRNYTYYARLTGKDLANNPDLALDPQTALFILVHGFRTGAFTGKKITDYINTDKADFINARRCINGLDRAERIAELALGYLADLEGEETAPEQTAPVVTGGVPIQLVLDAAFTLTHTDYRMGAEIKPGADPAQVTLTDCSETVEFACRVTGVKPVMPDGAMYQYAHCHKHGTVIPVTQALETPGALLFKFGEDPLQCVREDRRPSLAHVAFSLGGGETFEARSTASGVGYFDDAREQNWTHAALIPGVAYA